jgi:alkaline phosphatase D
VLHVWLGLEPDLSDAQLVGKSLPLNKTDGYAGVAPVDGLTPDTHYHYALTLYANPPDPYQSPYPEFTTFPQDGEPKSFAFAFGSCFRPEDEKGGKIFAALEEQRVRDNLRFILLVGDQIYADTFEYNSIDKVACTLDDYRAVYAYTWTRPHFRELMANMPAFMILDDHEVDDDWFWRDRNRQWAVIPWWDHFMRWINGRPPEERYLPRKRVLGAMQAYWEHQGMHAPPFVAPPTLTPKGQYDLDNGIPGALAYTFNYGVAAFFVMDTRTQRVKEYGVRQMLGGDQWQAIENWLLEVKDTYAVKFLVTSSAMLFQLRFDFPADRWSAFPEERSRLLHFIAANGIEGVYIIAGDMHSAHAVRAELYGPEGQSLPVWEFCSSPFDQEANKWAKILYRPLRGGPVRDSQLKFIIQEKNFGVVWVDFPLGDKPHVQFEVYGETGKLIDTVR